MFLGCCLRPTNRSFKNKVIFPEHYFQSTKDEEMDETNLHEVFERVLKIKISEKDFSHLFKQMDSMRDERITWDEFLSYLLLEFRLTGTAELKSQPMELPLKSLPELLPTRHRSAIRRIIFFPYLISPENRASSFQRGRYLTVSKDGVINYWSLDFVHQKSVKSTNRETNSLIILKNVRRKF